MTNKMKCSCCGKRVFDISSLPKEEVIIALKCPHCKQIVKIKCDDSSLMITKKKGVR